MRIFLINPPSSYSGPMALVEPMGLCYIGAVARDAGHEVRLRDVIYGGPEDLQNLFNELDEFLPDLVGFSAMTEAYPNALELAQAVKSRYGCLTVFGGWHVSGEPATVMEPAIDFVVRGEGEDTFLELLDHIQQGIPELRSIAGIAYKDGDSFKITPSRTRNMKLNNLPRPLREGLPLEHYHWPVFLARAPSQIRSLSVQASRGCPYKCSFCQTPTIWSNVWSKRSPAAVVDEIEDLVRDHHITTLFIRDEEFTIQPKWVMEICEEMCRRKLGEKLFWNCFARVDDVTPELANALNRAGCRRVFLGVEASDGDEDHSKRVQKFYKREEAEHAFRCLEAENISVEVGTIVGFPWDTRESIENAFQWLLKQPIDILNVYFAIPFGSTTLRKEAERTGLLLSTDPKRYTLREPLVATPHIPLDELKRLPQEMRHRFYMRPSQFWRLFKKAFHYKSGVRAVFERVLEIIFRTLRAPIGRAYAFRSSRAFRGIPAKYFDPLPGRTLKSAKKVDQTSSAA